ncbi:MAG TPA: EF-P beta-lysylation protein EpmB [Xanthomonadaceae bacterium]|nr:EF-P beta-lysylation protein EpmB [Xanthomonadaceae bacterium]
MIPATRPTTQPCDWRTLWRQAIRDPRELLAALDLQDLAARVQPGAAGAFPLRVPRGFVARMRRGDPADPLLRQVLPLEVEDRRVPGFGLDAVGDAAALAGPGMLHKYHGRALLIATGSCAVHCRYCFRRHFPYATHTAAADRWRGALDAVRGDPSITELILSGGDPLSLSDARLAELFEALPGLPQLRTLRIHTRLPVVLPERVDASLTALLAALPVRKVVVVHANHGNEIDSDVAAACTRLRTTGALLLNQSVLLRGVNDSADALARLSERLLDAGVLPYYLHQLDRVAGVAHFEVPEAEAAAILCRLRERLPGYLVPQWVRETAGAPCKTPMPARGGAVVISGNYV